MSVRADWQALSALFPTDGAPGWAREEVLLRDRSELASALEHWQTAATVARENRTEAKESHIESSRALERARGLAWICDEVRWIEDTALDF